MDPQPYSGYAGRRTQALDIRNLIGKILTKIWVCLAVLLCTTAIAAIIAYRTTPIYQAKVTIQVEQDRKVIDLVDVTQTEIRSIDALNTIAQAMLTRTIVSNVVQKLNLAADPAFLKIYGPAYTNSPSEESIIRTVF